MTCRSLPREGRAEWLPAQGHRMQRGEEFQGSSPTTTTSAGGQGQHPQKCIVSTAGPPRDGLAAKGTSPLQSPPKTHHPSRSIGCHQTSPDGGTLSQCQASPLTAVYGLQDRERIDLTTFEGQYNRVGARKKHKPFINSFNVLSTYCGLGVVQGMFWVYKEEEYTTPVLV